jgi:hypothetical protein
MTVRHFTSKNPFPPQIPNLGGVFYHWGSEVVLSFFTIFLIGNIQLILMEYIISFCDSLEIILWIISFWNCSVGSFSINPREIDVTNFYLRTAITSRPRFGPEAAVRLLWCHFIFCSWWIGEGYKVSGLDPPYSVRRLTGHRCQHCHHPVSPV